MRFRTLGVGGTIPLSFSLLVKNDSSLIALTRGEGLNEGGFAVTDDVLDSYL